MVVVRVLPLVWGLVAPVLDRRGIHAVPSVRRKAPLLMQDQQKGQTPYMIPGAGAGADAGALPPAPEP
jgi:hypothetical protein